MSAYPERSKCGHERYWIGNYGTCMCCRAEKAEAALAAEKQDKQMQVEALGKALVEAREREEVLRDALIDAREGCICGLNLLDGIIDGRTKYPSMFVRIKSGIQGADDLGANFGRPFFLAPRVEAAKEGEV